MAPDNKPQPEFTGDWHTDVGGVGNELQEVRAHFYSKKAQLKLSVEAEASLREKLKKGSGLVDKDRLTNADDFETPITKKWLYGALDTYFKDAVGVDDDGARKNEIFTSLYVIGTKINVDLLQKGWTIEIKKGLLYVKNGDNYVYSDVPLRLDEDAGADDVRENVVENQTPPQQAAERAGRAKKAVEKQKTTGSPERNMYDEEVDELPETPKTGAQSKEPQKARAPKKHEKNMYDVDSEAAVMGEPGSRIIGKEPRRVSARDSGLFGLPAVGGLADGGNVRKFQGDSGLFPTGEVASRTDTVDHGGTTAKPQPKKSDTPTAKPDKTADATGNKPLKMAAVDAIKLPQDVEPPKDDQVPAPQKAEDEQEEKPTAQPVAEQEQLVEAKEVNENIIEQIKKILLLNYDNPEVVPLGDENGPYDIDAVMEHGGIKVHDKIKLVLGNPKKGVEKGEIQFAYPLIGGIELEHLPKSKKLKFASAKAFQIGISTHVKAQNDALLHEILDNKESILNAWANNTNAQSAQTDPLATPLDTIKELTGDVDADSRVLKIGARAVEGYSFNIDLLTDENGQYTATVSNSLRFKGRVLELSANTIPNLVDQIATIINEDESQAAKRLPDLKDPGMRPLLPSRKRKPPEKWPGTEDKKEQEEQVNEELLKNEKKPGTVDTRDDHDSPKDVEVKESEEKAESPQEAIIRLMQDKGFVKRDPPPLPEGVEPPPAKPGVDTVEFYDPLNQNFIATSEISTMGTDSNEIRIVGKLGESEIHKLIAVEATPEECVSAFIVLRDNQLENSLAILGKLRGSKPQSLNIVFPDDAAIKSTHQLELVLRMEDATPNPIAVTMDFAAHKMGDGKVVLAAHFERDGKIASFSVPVGKDDVELKAEQLFNVILTNVYGREKMAKIAIENFTHKNDVKQQEVIPPAAPPVDTVVPPSIQNETTEIPDTKPDEQESPRESAKEAAKADAAFLAKIGEREAFAFERQKVDWPLVKVEVGGKSFEVAVRGIRSENRYEYIVPDQTYDGAVIGGDPKNPVSDPAAIRADIFKRFTKKEFDENDEKQQIEAAVELSLATGNYDTLVSQKKGDAHEPASYEVTISAKETAHQNARMLGTLKIINARGVQTEWQAVGTTYPNTGADPDLSKQPNFIQKLTALPITPADLGAVSRAFAEKIIQEEHEREESIRKEGGREAQEKIRQEAAEKFKRTPDGFMRQVLEYANRTDIVGRRTLVVKGEPENTEYPDMQKIRVRIPVRLAGDTNKVLTFELDIYAQQDKGFTILDGGRFMTHYAKIEKLIGYIQSVLRDGTYTQKTGDKVEQIYGTFGGAINVQDSTDWDTKLEPEKGTRGGSIDTYKLKEIKQKIETPTKKFFENIDLKSALAVKDDGSIEIQVTTKEGIPVSHGIEAVFTDPTNQERGVLKFTEPLATGLIAPGIVMGPNGKLIYRKTPEVKFSSNADMLNQLDKIYVKTAKKLAERAAATSSILADLIKLNIDYKLVETYMDSNPPYMFFGHKDRTIKVFLVPQYEQKKEKNAMKYGYKAIIYKNGVEETQVWGPDIASMYDSPKATFQEEIGVETDAEKVHSLMARINLYLRNIDNPDAIGEQASAN